MEITEEELANKLNDAVREAYWLGIDRFHRDTENAFLEMGVAGGLPADVAHALRIKIGDIHGGLSQNVPEARSLFEMLSCDKCHKDIGPGDLRHRDIICKACSIAPGADSPPDYRHTYVGENAQE